VSAALSIAPLQFIGRRSYSWYLWHWPFLVFAAILFPRITVAQKLETAAASLLMADCTYRWVERPVREHRVLIRSVRLSACAAALAGFMTVAVAVAAVHHARDELELDRRYEYVAAATTDYGFDRLECYTDGQTESSFEVRVCLFGDPKRGRSIALFGDSHAMQWINAMRKVTSSAGWSLITVVRPGCAASDINPHQLTDAEDRCKKWRSAAIDRIIEMAPTAVVMASHNGATVQPDEISSAMLPVEEVRLGTRRTLASFVAAGIPAIVLRDSPLPPFDIPKCISRSIARSSGAAKSCEFDATPALNPEAASAERAATEGLAKVFYLDVDDLICPGNTCPAIRNGKIIYRDENHLAGSFAESLAPELKARLMQLLGEADAGPALSKTGG
jgi:hypothetical protein